VITNAFRFFRCVFFFFAYSMTLFNKRS